MINNTKTMVEYVEEKYPDMDHTIKVKDFYDMIRLIGKATDNDVLYSYGYSNGYYRLNSIKVFNNTISPLVEICEYQNKVPVKKDILRRVSFIIIDPLSIDREENPLESIMIKVVDIYRDITSETKISVFNEDRGYLQSAYLMRLNDLFRLFRFPENVFDSFKRSVLYSVKEVYKEAIIKWD